MRVALLFTIIPTAAAVVGSSTIYRKPSGDDDADYVDYERAAAADEFHRQTGGAPEDARRLAAPEDARRLAAPDDVEAACAPRFAEYTACAGLGGDDGSASARDDGDDGNWDALCTAASRTLATRCSLSLSADCDAEWRAYLSCYYQTLCENEALTCQNEATPAPTPGDA
eukprot:CAMPEP_0119260138 /NCGR_PEP_ID=MMETSP1329-20130426/671_1 /TAXON_ID=114041 /ORGANISM="Genus nov. species nov., Strain RCC1024" /LENGTH=169 /DNA_ID=CAMNT_0007259557 /DNA_START=167 /DNA_END=673 /DNA_ORIENTATION=-